MEHERYDSAGVVLWLVAALNMLAGVPLLVTGSGNGDGFAVTMGVILVVTALLLGGLGFAVRRGSRIAVIVAVVILGLVMALRAAPLLAGDVRLGNVVSVVVTGFLLYIVARPLAPADR